MNWMLPSMRLRAATSACAAWRSARLRSASVISATGVAGGVISPSSRSSPASSLGLSPSAGSPSSASFFSRSATLSMALEPFSNSSWHLLSSRRRKSMSLPPSGLRNLGVSLCADTTLHMLAYSSEKCVSVSALSKILSIRPSSVRCSLMPTSSMILVVRRSKLSGVILFRMPWKFFWRFSSSGSSLWLLPATKRFSARCSAGRPPRAPRAPGDGGGGGPRRSHLSSAPPRLSPPPRPPRPPSMPPRPPMARGSWNLSPLRAPQSSPPPPPPPPPRPPPGGPRRPMASLAAAGSYASSRRGLDMRISCA
mmetsp:Transcript_13528/g.33179  ORF Transcript_13528/g.33179 Transcript_13528/m.33179 type:complete len:309 (-) Transcript_13528:658-1584(-)